jgi:hypothetical protein
MAGWPALSGNAAGSMYRRTCPGLDRVFRSSASAKATQVLRGFLLQWLRDMETREAPPTRPNPTQEESYRCMTRCSSNSSTG